MKIAETAAGLLRQHALLMDEIVDYIGAVYEIWHSDLMKWREEENEKSFPPWAMRSLQKVIMETVRPILQSAGMETEEVEKFSVEMNRLLGVPVSTIDAADDNDNENNNPKDSAIVPLETPVQMDLSPITAQMIDAPRNVLLDWLSDKRVMASQVDRTKLAKAEEKLRSKASERKDRREKTAATAVTAIVEERSSDPAALVDAILAESEDRRIERDIHLDPIDISLAGRRILTGAKLLLAAGRRYGLVGRNGIGKSTLLRHIATRQIAGLPRHLSILHVEQEVRGDDTTTALQSVLSADLRREALLAEESRLQTAINKDQSDLSSLERLAAIHRKLQESDADGAAARASAILHGLGFSQADQDRPTRHFSGGWRMRLALAQALFCQPDLLLLDEPTNMLDFPAVVWLENYLRDWAGTILVVSHDRIFLDGVATDILHMHNEQLDAYRGDYGQFLSTRTERLKNQQREYEAQLLYRQHLQAFIDRWRYNANRAPQAQSRLKILEKLPDLRPVTVEAPIVFRFPPVEALSPPLIQADEASFAYPGDDQPMLLQHISLNIQLTSRMAIVGPNGAGKTTLLRLLIGQLEPVQGRVQVHGRLRVAFFSQHHVDQLDLNLNAIQLLQSRHPGHLEEEYRRHLGAFGLSGPLALQPIRTLSGGQKSRVVFAAASLTLPHLMVLDEPTNHLDMDTIDALTRALREYQGGVVVVSHDKKFIDGLCEEILVLQDGRLERYQGSIHEYARSLAPSIGSRQ